MSDLIDDLIEAARLLGATQAKKEIGCYTREDARFERAMHESISDKAKRLTAERDELRRQLAEAEQRFDWLATRLEDVQIDDADPNDHYHGDEEDVPYPVLWKRAVDTAMGASNE